MLPGAFSSRDTVALPELPIELCDIILGYLILLYPLSQSCGSSLPLIRRFCTRHALSSYALVCRSWAAACQAAIFQDIVLDSKETFFKLIDLARSPGSRFSKYVQCLTLRPINLSTQDPWLHLPNVVMGHAPSDLFDPYERVFPNLTRLHLHLNGSENKVGVESGIHHRMPSTTPGFSLGIKELHLSNLAFNVEHLVHTCNQLPSLELLSGDKISLSPWIPTSFNPNRFHALRQSTTLDVQCHMQNWIASALAYALRRRSKAASRLAHADLVMMFSSVQAMSQIASSMNGSCNVRSVACKDSLVVDIAQDSRRLLLSMTFLWDSPPEPDTQDQHINKIIFSFAPVHGIDTLTDILPRSRMTRYEWTLLDHFASSLRALDAMEFHCITQADADIVTNLILPKMRSCNADKLKCVLLNLPDTST